MNDKLKQKMEYCLVGWGFTGLNLYANFVNQPLFGIAFGITAMVFFIRALRVKP